MDPTLMFIAGRITGERGWTDAAVISVLQLEDLEPTGVPLVVVAEADDITPLVARLISSVDAVGRPIMLVTDDPPDPAAAVWIDAQLMRSLATNAIPKLAPDSPATRVTDKEAVAKAGLDAEQEVPGLAPDPFLDPDTESEQQAESDSGQDDKTDAKSKQASPPPQRQKGKSETPQPKAETSSKSSKKSPPAHTKAKSESGGGGKASAEVFREFRSLAGE
ncbi:MAG: hypothetical protein K0U64_06265 [Actinomycetia bacterium]|nr:hypothetical protein [Actinomycetes bacterium]